MLDTLKGVHELSEQFELGSRLPNSVSVYLSDGLTHCTRASLEEVAKEFDVAEQAKRRLIARVNFRLMEDWFNTHPRQRERLLPKLKILAKEAGLKLK